MLTLQYYKIIFKNDPEKLDKVRHLIEEDFRRAEHIFFDANRARDITKMKNQLHKISPIISNLKYDEFVALINAYRTHDEYSSELELLNAKLKEYFAQVYQFLQQ